MKQLLIIGTGGFVGAVLRYTICGTVQKWMAGRGFPYGTLVVNVAGCLLIGLLSQLVESRDVLSPSTQSFVLVGLLGALTTFSTFSNETLNLFAQARPHLALFNLIGHLLLGLGAVWGGRALAGMMWE